MRRQTNIPQDTLADTGDGQWGGGLNWLENNRTAKKEKERGDCLIQEMTLVGKVIL